MVLKKQDDSKVDEKVEPKTEIAVDSTATEPAVPDDAEVLAPSHDSAARASVDPADDPSIPKRAPGGDSPNESPEIALAPVEIPDHDSNVELARAAQKRGEAGPGAPVDRRAERKTTAEG